jgi:hypothetical protein
MHLRNFFFHALDTITQPVLGKFPIKVKISMTISNSVFDWNGKTVTPVEIPVNHILLAEHAKGSPHNNKNFKIAEQIDIREGRKLPTHHYSTIRGINATPSPYSNNNRKLSLFAQAQELQCVHIFFARGLGGVKCQKSCVVGCANVPRHGHRDSIAQRQLNVLYISCCSPKQVDYVCMVSPAPSTVLMQSNLVLQYCICWAGIGVASHFSGSRFSFQTKLLHWRTGAAAGAAVWAALKLWHSISSPTSMPCTLIPAASKVSRSKVVSFFL